MRNKFTENDILSVLEYVTAHHDHYLVGLLQWSFTVLGLGKNGPGKNGPW